ncbi:MAG: tRNA epoxyqueuosine(34) reductase QueG [Gammaproteobacteria bacterium]|nr:tRNA epoxyqueuosine(34) reductase QueG [Gammaproteobacteria bacterium]
MPHNRPLDPTQLTNRIKTWGMALGFDQVGVSDTDLRLAEQRLEQWLERGMHAEMDYMARHGRKRSRPAALVSGTRRIISVRMDYLPEPLNASLEVLDDPVRAFVSRYALGRDYHKVLRQRLQRLAQRIEAAVGEYAYRVFVDSAPVLEKPLAEQAGLGWIGKHSNLINRQAGSWFFLGEIYTDLPLRVDDPADNHCGRCRACLDICPTRAIVEPYQVDAGRCISYLTIELKGSIPIEFRRAMGNRIYGCDDCQQVCPWNRFARLSEIEDFAPRHALDSTSLCEVFSWDETWFLKRTEGSAIRRLGHARWLRNIAVALGNAPGSAEIIQALQQRLDHPSAMVREHVIWALEQHDVG